jgi:3,4-dihydroxy-2-butanone 4-phosphate synthase
MAQLDDCLAFAREHKLETISVEMIRKWRQDKAI